MIDRLILLVADALETPVTIEAKAGDPVEWDSLGHLRVILAAEESFGVRFKTERIAELTSIESIAAELYVIGQ